MTNICPMKEQYSKQISISYIY